MMCSRDTSSKCCICNSTRSFNPHLSYYPVPCIPIRDSDKMKKFLLSKRQQAWLIAIGIHLTEDQIKCSFVCSLHFVSKKPSLFNDISSVDWIPSCNLPLVVMQHVEKLSQFREEVSKEYAVLLDQLANIDVQSDSTSSIGCALEGIFIKCEPANNNIFIDERETDIALLNGPAETMNEDPLSLTGDRGNFANGNEASYDEPIERENVTEDEIIKLQQKLNEITFQRDEALQNLQTKTEECRQLQETVRLLRNKINELALRKKPVRPKKLKPILPNPEPITVISCIDNNQSTS